MAQSGSGVGVSGLTHGGVMGELCTHPTCTQLRCRGLRGQMQGVVGAEVSGCQHGNVMGDSAPTPSAHDSGAGVPGDRHRG